jgi:deoxycytidylate deaminase
MFPLQSFPSQSFPSQSPLLCQVTTRDEKFATIALNEANKSTVKYHQHGCVAVVGGRIVERGYNSYRSRSNDGFLEGTCSCHAEVDVMRKLDKRLNKSSNNCSNMNKGNKSKNNKSKNNKNSQVSGRDVTQCFLRAREPIRCKKRQARREV